VKTGAFCAFRIVLVAVYTVLLLGACTAADEAALLAPWTPASLSLLDLDDAPLPAADILAVYLRQQDDRIQIRLDLLEPGMFNAADFYLAFDTCPGGAAELPIHSRAGMDWDFLLSVPARGSIQLQQSNGAERAAAGVLVWRDPQVETLLIDLNRQALTACPGSADLGFNPGYRIRAQAFAAQPGEARVLDQSGIASLGAIPLRAANALLAFWNVYPAYSPATALRRWDGAHTGPLGSRHGLYNLLRSARAARLPVILLDLNSPAQLSALDYAGGLELAREMQSAGLLVLPEVPAAAGQTAGQPAFLSTERWEAHKTIPLARPAAGTTQANWNGLELDLKRQLIQSAVRQNAAAATLSLEYVPLGGELPLSGWGDPRSARAALRWLKSHPWVRLLDAHSLQAARFFPAPPQGEGANGADRSLSEGLDPALLSALQRMPANPLSLAAWQAYAALSAPVFPQPAELPDLRKIYAGQVWSIIEAAEWAQAPHPIAGCEVDPDRDGAPECVLASETVYAQIEIETASLTFLFGFATDSPAANPSSQSAHQMIGPSSQFISGLSDAATWDLHAGLSADPAVIPGAFGGPGHGFEVTRLDESLVLNDLQAGLRKIFRLESGGILLRIERDHPAHSDQKWTAEIPLALDPWQRFTPGWANRYQGRPTVYSYEWALRDGPAIRVRSNLGLKAVDFHASQMLFSAPEDPNREPPGGYYLPFPLALVEAVEPDWIEILLQPTP